MVPPSGTYEVVIVGGGASGLACAVAYMQALERDACNCQAEKHASCQVAKSGNPYQTTNDRTNQTANQTKNDATCQVANGVPVANKPRVVILEAGKRIGASIMRSGNGRCNFSNASLDLSRYYHASFVQEAFSALDSNCHIPSVVDWFEQLGLVWEEMPGSGGLLYPFSKKANSVLDVLRKALDEYDVELCEMSTVNVVCSDAESSVQMRDRDGLSAQRAFCVRGETRMGDDERVPFEITARNVVIASGGATPQEMLSSYNLSYRNPEPILGPLQAKPSVPISLKALDGIRMQAKITLVANTQSGKVRTGVQDAEILRSVTAHCDVAQSDMTQRDVPQRSAARQDTVRDNMMQRDVVRSDTLRSDTAHSNTAWGSCVFEEEGEVLFREYGLSGIVIFNASRYAKQGDTLLLDIMPHYTQETLLDFFRMRLTQQRSCLARTFFTGFVVNPLAEALLRAVDIDGDARLTEADIEALAQVCKALPFYIQGMADARTCQVRRGGIQPKEVNPSTMQVCSCPGLFVLGEALDVDGPCGGYNLHWAWTTGLLSGTALALSGK